MDNLIQNLKNKIEEDEQKTKQSFENVKNDMSGLQDKEKQAEYWNKRQSNKQLQKMNSKKKNQNNG